MTSLQQIHDFLELKRFAVVGVSRQPQESFSRAVLKEFLARGFEAVPVNPDADEIDGQPCFHRLTDIRPPSGGRSVHEPRLRQPTSWLETVLLPAIGHVWMFRGRWPGSRDARCHSVLRIARHPRDSR